MSFESEVKAIIVQQDNPLIILDVDETLIFATENPIRYEADLIVGQYYIYKRPHLEEFLLTIFEPYKLAVWTSAGEKYAAEVIDKIFPRSISLEFLWTRERCTRRFNSEEQTSYFVKDLKKVKRRGFSLERILMVDDTPEKLERNYGNHVRVSPFVGDRSDTELKDLTIYLMKLSQVDNFLRIEKRGWRNLL